MRSGREGQMSATQKQQKQDICAAKNWDGFECILAKQAVGLCQIAKNGLCLYVGLFAVSALPTKNVFGSFMRLMSFFF